MDIRTALLTILDQVDYANGACRVNDMVGAVLPKEVIALARQALKEDEERIRRQPELQEKNLVYLSPKS